MKVLLLAALALGVASPAAATDWWVWNFAAHQCQSARSYARTNGPFFLSPMTVERSARLFDPAGGVTTEVTRDDTGKPMMVTVYLHPSNRAPVEMLYFPEQQYCETAATGLRENEGAPEELR